MRSGDDDRWRPPWVYYVIVHKGQRHVDRVFFPRARDARGAQLPILIRNNRPRVVSGGWRRAPANRDAGPSGA